MHSFMLTEMFQKCIKMHQNPLAERAFNFPNMAFFRLSPNLVQKRYGNVTEMFI